MEFNELSVRAPGTEPGTKQELLPVPTTLPPPLLSALPTQRAAIKWGEFSFLISYWHKSKVLFH